ncbi:MAG: ADP-ribosylglycohydrolase family protein [Anaerolineae bacterium]
MTTRLYDKVFGCLAASQVGSAMGAPVEGKSHDEIKARYGWLDRLVPYRLGGNVYPPGTTEDGVERQKLMVLSIIDNNGPITARDLAKTWLKYVDEENFGILAGQQDEIHYRLIRAGISPEDSGYYDAHYGRMGFNRACHPIGIVNACFPELAAKNALDVARLYQPPTGRGIPWKESKKIFPLYTIGIDWSAAVCAAIAEAFKPTATPDSVIEQATAYVVEPARDEILAAVEIADGCSDYEEIVAEFYQRYYAVGLPMAQSRAFEVTSKAMALFYVYKGDVRATMEAAVNMGRDTDCLASVSAGIAGAFSGSGGIPDAWIAQVNASAKENRALSVTDMPLEDQAQGLHDALLAHYARMEDSLHALGGLQN